MLTNIRFTPFKGETTPIMSNRISAKRRLLGMQLT